MRSASECRERAEECRALAGDMVGERRQQFLSMAETWEGLAREVECASNRRITDILKVTYSKVAQEPVPEIFHNLLKQLEAAEARRG